MPFSYSANSDKQARFFFAITKYGNINSCLASFFHPVNNFTVSTEQMGCQSEKVTHLMESELTHSAVPKMLLYTPTGLVPSI